MEIPGKQKTDFSFSRLLLRWNREKNTRQMPWKGERDPYKIWLSEVILQQTRVEQGLKYYENFIANFPDIGSLASASEQTVYKLWEGLGYYTRCRNLIQTARFVCENLAGKFPDNFEEIKKLNGVGPYTAAAISSFAFDEPRAVVDGNVFRVLSRVFGIEQPIDTLAGKKYFNDLANRKLDKRQAASYNQAIMDFGAVVCRPVPECEICPFRQYCEAFLHNRVRELPVKSKQVRIKKRWFYYLLFEHKGKLAIRQRLAKDIWHNLFEFLLIESAKPLNKKALIKKIDGEYWITDGNVQVKSVSSVYRQQLTHQLIEGRFIELQLDRKPKLPREVTWVAIKEIKKYPFPKFINQHLQTIEI